MLLSWYKYLGKVAEKRISENLGRISIHIQKKHGIWQMENLNHKWKLNWTVKIEELTIQDTLKLPQKMSRLLENCVKK